MASERKSSRGRVSSSEPYVESQPIAGPDAFLDLTSRSGLQSQAATLLLIGSRLRGDARVVEARAQAFAAITTPPASRPAEALPNEDLSALAFPTLQPDTSRFSAVDLQKVLGVRFSAVKTGKPVPAEAQMAAKALPDAARAFYQDANVETAAALLEASLRHPDELVRCAAASSYFEIGTDSSQVIAVLEHGLTNKSGLTRDVAATALAQIDPANPALRPLLRPKRIVSHRKPSRTSTIVHGTWAASATWWQPPSGDFWTYLHDNVDPSLYGANDRFGWSGGYSDAARSKAGTDLNAWVTGHNLNGLDLCTHSHGGSVAMLANHLGTRVGKMVLLSCPVHWPKYTPDFTRVDRVISVRVHLDLVILADRGGQKFSDSRIDEHVLPMWFDHSATHNPSVWQKYNVAQWVKAPAPSPPAPDPSAAFHTGLEKPLAVFSPVKLKRQPGKKKLV